MLGIRKKTKKRVEVIDRIVNVITHPEIYGTINYRQQSEDKITQFIYQHLLRELRKIYLDYQNLKDSTAKKKARANLLWEGAKQTTVNNYLFLGAYHRPDMVVNYSEDMRIALEFKKGDQGMEIRQGIGQALVHSSAFDFVIYLFIDTSKEKKVFSSASGKKEQALIDILWDDFNIKFVVT